MTGLTAPIPLEILIAAERQPVDLLQLFLQETDPAGVLDEAAQAGFAEDASIIEKGLYGTILRHGIREVVIAVTGDRPVRELATLLQQHDVRIIFFYYPLDRCRETLALEIKKLARHFDAAPVDIDRVHHRLADIRDQLHRIDRLCWQDEKISSQESFSLQLAASDMRGDPESFAAELDRFIDRAERNQPKSRSRRIACLGDVPLWNDLFLTIEEFDARVVYHEIPHQIGMPHRADSLVEQYLAFDLPYDVPARLHKSLETARERNVDGLVFIRTGNRPASGITEILLRQQTELPLLVLDCQATGPLDLCSRLRLKDFLTGLDRNQ
ncbi:2-hydroxyglutaryl-CoA dehydratase D-component [Geothermobacter ehrlichii]|uniref:2-hydroxyglutaryl-CoA dehydratase D-component n=1 Tax=Geothermobacter ehrlichii TaxID=213224 RepID=A0A5D3WKS3_9BACT|nr:2-hydroxyacyl-CoA dehydratase family protein [Geothermobacter ehrlichii]TYO97141.1 2-hydroxyglutaryl-CoA dehydratase D-component [Geothermobacter ehrlichii]